MVSSVGSFRVWTRAMTTWRALDLVFEAMEADDVDQALDMAREALNMSQDSSDAYLLLSEYVRLGSEEEAAGYGVTDIRH